MVGKLPGISDQKRWLSLSKLTFLEDRKRFSKKKMDNDRYQQLRGKIVNWKLSGKVLDKISVG